MDNEVDHPDHYTAFPVEVIDMIKVVLTEAGKKGISAFEAYCFGNEIKYRMRAGLKDDQDTDLAKARMYKHFREECKDG